MVENRLDRNERLCQICESSTDIEDENHFVLVCKKYSDLRKQYIPKKYWEKTEHVEILRTVKIKVKICVN
jgi:hypothetical protein